MVPFLNKVLFIGMMSHRHNCLFALCHMNIHTFVYVPDVRPRKGSPMAEDISGNYPNASHCRKCF